jgi:UDP-N-acetylmuramate--alanine ligase
MVEADEFDRTFLRLSPSMAVITNIEAEHLDIYEDLDDVKSAFIEFANKVPFYGAVIVCLDDPTVRSILPDMNAEPSATDLRPRHTCGPLTSARMQFKSTFTVLFERTDLRVKLS